MASKRKRMAALKVFRDSPRRRGYAMIVLVVVIALGVLLFVLQKAGVLQRGPGDPNAEGIMPWTEWESRQKLEGESAESDESAPALILGALKYDGNLRLVGTGEPRGEITIFIGGDFVGGGWYGGYHNSRTKRQYDLMNSGFSGKFYPDKKYVDEQGNEDASKRYFLCMGKFAMQETGKQIVRLIAGEIYVRGWMDEDNMLTGRVFITSDHKNYHEFEYSGKAK